MPKTAISRLWEVTRHVLSIRGLLQWTGWWQPVSAVLLSHIIAVGSATKGIPWPLSVLIGLIAFVVILVIWRAFVPARDVRRRDEADVMAAREPHGNMQAPLAPRTNSWLRKYAAGVAGDLFALLVETGEKLDTPTMTWDQYGEALFGDRPSDDPRITERASERSIETRIKEAILCAGDLGLLAEPSAWSTSVANVEDVRSRIRDMRLLSDSAVKGRR